LFLIQVKRKISLSNRIVFLIWDSVSSSLALIQLAGGGMLTHWRVQSIVSL
jgi:hypothetical protein